MPAHRITLKEAFQKIGDTFPNVRGILRFIWDEHTNTIREDIALDKNNNFKYLFIDHLSEVMRNRPSDEYNEIIVQFWMALQDNGYNDWLENWSINTIPFFRMWEHMDDTFIRSRLDDLNTRLSNITMDEMHDLMDILPPTIAHWLPSFSEENQSTLLYHIGQRAYSPTAIFNLFSDITDTDYQQKIQTYAKELFEHIDARQIASSMLYANIPTEPKWLVDTFLNVWTEDRLLEALNSNFGNRFKTTIEWSGERWRALQGKDMQHIQPEVVNNALDTWFDMHKTKTPWMNALQHQDIVFTRPKWIDECIEHAKKQKNPVIEQNLLLAASHYQKWDVLKPLIKNTVPSMYHDVDDLRTYSRRKEFLDLTSFRSHALKQLTEEKYSSLLEHLLNSIEKGMYSLNHSRLSFYEPGCLLSEDEFEQFYSNGIRSIPMMEATVALDRIIPNATIKDLQSLLQYIEIENTIMGTKPTRTEKEWLTVINMWKKSVGGPIEDTALELEP